MIFSGLRNSIIVIVAAMFMQSCARDKNDINNLQIRIENDTSAQALKVYKRLNISDTIKTKEIKASFFNNPYSIDSTYHLALILNNTYIVYDEQFNGYSFKVKAPLRYVARFNELMFILSKNGKSYYFNTPKVCKLDENDDLLEIVFAERDEYEQFYFTFTRENKINWLF